MTKRRYMSRGHSRKLFTRTAKRVHPRNRPSSMRGGYRL